MLNQFRKAVWGTLEGAPGNQCSRHFTSATDSDSPGRQGRRSSSTVLTRFSAMLMLLVRGPHLEEQPHRKHICFSLRTPDRSFSGSTGTKTPKGPSHLALRWGPWGQRPWCSMGLSFLHQLGARCPTYLYQWAEKREAKEKEGNLIK